MYKIKLILQNRFLSRRTSKKIESISRQPSSTSLFWTIAAFSMKLFIIVFFGALVLFPFFYMISTSLMSDAESKIGNVIVPQSGMHWENFAKAFQDGYWSALLVTLLVTAITIVLKLLLTMTMGYAYSYKNWRFKNLSWNILLMLLMIPEVALVVGQYTLMSKANLNVGYGAIVAMILPFVASVFSGYMFRNAFEAIPDRIKEAALSDGASEFTYFWKVALPMVAPTTWTVVILTAFASWNSYMWPQLLLAGDPNAHHVLATWLFTTGREVDAQGNDLGTMMNIRLAASLLTTIPMVIAYFLFRTRIMNAISKQGSTIKG